jgi:hypothetical protein
LNETKFPSLSQINLDFLDFFSLIQTQSIPFTDQILFDFSINNYNLIKGKHLKFIHKHLADHKMIQLLSLLSTDILIYFVKSNSLSNPIPFVNLVSFDDSPLFWFYLLRNSSQVIISKYIPNSTTNPFLFSLFIKLQIEVHINFCNYSIQGLLIIV